MSAIIGIDLSCLEIRPETGVERYARRLVESIGPEADGLLVLGLARPGLVAPDVTAPMRIETVASAFPRVAWRETALPGAVKRLGVQVLHCPVTAMPTRLRIPMVVTVHDVPATEGPERAGRLSRHQLRLGFAARRADRIIVPSLATAAALAERFPGAQDRIEVVPHGVDPDFRPAGPPLARDRHGIGAGPYLLHVGTIRPRKGIETLVQAFARLAREPDFRDLQLVLAGDLRMPEAELFETVDDADVRSRIHLPGYFPRAELPNLFRSAAAVVLPSWLEGFGLPALEAMACGRPLVTSDDPALADLVAGAATIAPRGDAMALASVTAELLRSPARQATTTEAGLARASDFDWARTAREHVRIYRELV